MAEPIPFREQNAVLGRGDNPDSVCELPIHRAFHNGFGHEVISCWKMTKPEIEEIARTGVVWVRMVGVTGPPIGVQGYTPFCLPS